MDQIKLFIEKARSDAGLMAQLEKMRLRDATVDEYIALAAEYGFTITQADYENAMTVNMPKSGEITEEQLEDVSGGILVVSDECWFKDSGEYRYFTHAGENRVRARCTERCTLFLAICGCRGWSACVDGWHEVHIESAVLWPENFRNHDEKGTINIVRNSYWVK